MRFYISSYVLILLGISCLPLVENAYIAFFLAFPIFTFGFLISGVFKKFHLSPSTRYILFILALVLAINALLNVGKLGRWELSWFVWYLLFAIQLINIFSIKSKNGWLFSYLLSILHIGVAAQYTESPIFIAFFLTFLIVAPSAFNSLASWEREKDEEKKAGFTGRLDLYKWIGLSTLNISFLTIILFLSLPRAKSPFFTFKQRLRSSREGKGITEELRPASPSPTLQGYFSDSFPLGEVSELRKENILIMLVETNRPLLWRVKAFDWFSDGRWHSTPYKLFELWGKKDHLRLRPFYLSSEILFTTPVQQFVHQKFIIKNYKQNLLISAYQPIEILNLGVEKIKIDHLENVYLDEPLGPGRVYEVISIEKLYSFRYLKSSPRQYPEMIRRIYLRLPENLDRRIKELTWHILRDVPPQPYLEVVALRDYLIRNCTYDTKISPKGVNALSEFLFEKGRGDCEHFATALAVMLRIAGIPSRFVIGFASGDYDPKSRTCLVYSRHAHAWVEVYFPKVGWVTCDAVPGSQFGHPWEYKGRRFTKSKFIPPLVKEGKRKKEEKIKEGEEKGKPEKEGMIQEEKGKLTEEEKEISGKVKEEISKEEKSVSEEKPTPEEDKVGEAETEEEKKAEKEKTLGEERIETAKPEEVKERTPEARAQIQQMEGKSEGEIEGGIPQEKQVLKWKTLMGHLSELWEKWILKFSYESQRLILVKIETLLVKALIKTKQGLLGLKSHLLRHKFIYMFCLYVLLLLMSCRRLYKILRRRKARQILFREVKKPLTPQQKVVMNFYLKVLHMLERKGYRRPPHLTPREFAYEILKRGLTISKELLYLTEVFYKVSFGKTELNPEEVKAIQQKVEAIRNWCLA